MQTVLGIATKTIREWKGERKKWKSFDERTLYNLYGFTNDE
jgi:hypothetical protein